jgi:hypothetical protein
MTQRRVLWASLVSARSDARASRDKHVSIFRLRLSLFDAIITDVATPDSHPDCRATPDWRSRLFAATVFLWQLGAFGRGVNACQLGNCKE